MSRKLPPLNALRAFEAAGRYLSLSRAAEELHVTPAAVSHQVKALEEYLGVPLFKRLNRALLLTDAGQACLPGLREGFDRLAEAVEGAVARDSRRPLCVSVAPSFGGSWLIPRLEHFREAHPEWEVRVDASSKVVDLASGDVDVAIRYGPGHYPGLMVNRLLDDEIVPVCSPRLVKDGLCEPTDLARYTLLHLDTEDQNVGYPDWKMWLLAAGVTDCDPLRGPRLNPVTMLMEAAVEGQGVALVGQIIAAQHLEEGRLVKPFELHFPSQFSYFVVHTEAAARRPDVMAFRDWLLDEAGVTRAG